VSCSESDIDVLGERLETGVDRYGCADRGLASRLESPRRLWDLDRKGFVDRGLTSRRDSG